MMSETTITLDSREEAILLFGSRDSYLKEIRSALGLLQMVGRGDQIIIKGGDDQLALAERVFAQLRQMLRDQGSLSAEDVKTVLEVVTQRRRAADRGRRTRSRRRASAATSGRAPTARPATSAPCANTT